ncbi:MAG TPA: hypothetical protein VND64_26930 [Pirellulales bacterium]|nr:hypothetical protein [Pirellulales bacterium]
MLAGIGIGVCQTANSRLRRKEEDDADSAMAELFGIDEDEKANGERNPNVSPTLASPRIALREGIGSSVARDSDVLDGAVDPLADSSDWIARRAAQPCNNLHSRAGVLDTPRIKEHRDLLEPMCMSIATILPPRRAPRRPRQSRFGLAVLALCLGLVAFLQSRPSATTPPNAHTVVVENAASPAPRDSAPRTIAMKDVDLCDRSVGEHPDRSTVDETIPDVDPPTWRRLQLRMRKAGGNRLWMKLIEPLDVIEQMGAQVGGTVYLDMPEYGAKGEAEVLLLGPCPPVKAGVGNVVTGKFIHESDGELVDLLLVGDSTPTGVTPNHLYWSLDRREFIGAGDLRPGERVSIASGETSVASVEPRPAVGMLYNLRIHREHVYRVGELGVLVHNSCLDDFADLDFNGQKIAGRGFGIDEADNFPDLALHGNRLDSPGAHVVYAVIDTANGSVLRFGETGNFISRSQYWRNWFETEKGLIVDVLPLRVAQGKEAAKALETRFISTFKSIFGVRPRFNRTNH